jgi:glycine cleavage system aminomethyltransferase T
MSLNTRRWTPCTGNSVPAWCPSPATTCPCSMPAASSPSIRHTREPAGLFDVSHMGQFLLEGPGVAATLESLVPADLEALGEHRQTYTLLTNDDGRCAR